MNFLEDILRRKRDEVAERKRRLPVGRLKDQPHYSREPLSLARAVTGRCPSVIAEVKKASPSRQVIREDFDPYTLARSFIAGGASALSVLTDEEFFQGRLEFLTRMRDFVPLPLLRKDFIIDSYQVHESKAAGADAVLLIVAALGAARLQELAHASRELGLECLVEVHDEAELETASAVRADVLGINNRDLSTFRTDLETTVRLAKLLPPGVPVVSESGIASPEDLRRLMRHGINAFLIGESLMRAEDPGAALASLLRNVDGLRP